LLSATKLLAIQTNKQTIAGPYMRANPSLTFKEVAVKVGAKWKSLDSAGKKPYMDMAAADKARHTLETVYLDNHSSHSFDHAALPTVAGWREQPPDRMGAMAAVGGAPFPGPANGMHATYATGPSKKRRRQHPNANGGTRASDSLDDLPSQTRFPSVYVFVCMFVRVCSFVRLF
jgi:hypothetical protein